MICSQCKKRTAVVFINKIENGVSSMEGLCKECAKKRGLDVPETTQYSSISDSKLDDIEKRLDRLERMFKQVEKTSPFIVVSDHKVKLKNENTVPVVMTDEQFKILLNSILR